MAEPWSDDLAALGDETRRGLRSLAATRASVPKATPMRFHKAHPALAALIALLVIGITAPLAYAFVRHVVLTVDPDKPTDQIEKDVTDQLHTAGVESTVKATRSEDGQLEIRITTSDDQLGSDLSVNGSSMPVHQSRGINIKCHECTPDQQQLATKTASADEVLDLIDDDVAIGPAIEKALAAKGFANIEVHVAADAVNVSVGTAPAAAAAPSARP